MREALNILLLGEVAKSSVLSELDVLVRQLDAEYFSLGNATQGSPALLRFSQARAIQSLVFAMSAPNLESTADAVYEAAMSLEEPLPLLRAVWGAVG